MNEEMLDASKGSTLTFTYGGRKINSLSVSADRIGRENHLEKIAEGSVQVPNEGSKNGHRTIRLQIHRFGNRAHVAAELPAGKYVVAAFVRVP